VVERLRAERDYEMIGGRVYMMSRPNMNHIKISGNIYSIFKRFLKGNTCKVYTEPDVFLDDENNFIPDIVVLCDKNKEKYKGIYGAPDIVVEILSPSTEMRDFHDKKAVYGNTGVKEYWIVDPMAKKITVYGLSGQILEPTGMYYHRTAEQLEVMSEDERRAIISKFKVGLFSELEIELSEVFEDVL